MRQVIDLETFTIIRHSEDIETRRRHRDIYKNRGKALQRMKTQRQYTETRQRDNDLETITITRHRDNAETGHRDKKH